MTWSLPVTAVYGAAAFLAGFTIAFAI